MDEIPIEILEMIFERLPVGQLNECRQVNKKWQFTIDCRMDFDCLVVHRGLPPVNETFFPTNKKVILRYCILWDDFNHESEWKKPIYRRFRRVWLCDYSESFSRVTKRFHILTRYRVVCDVPKVAQIMNYLNQLEELHLCPISMFNLCSSTLSLPNLKTFKQTGHFDRQITLDAPQLVNLSVHKKCAVNLVHPETIERFEWLCDSSAFQIPLFYEYLTSLTSLKHLLIQTKYLIFNRELYQQHGIFEFLRDKVEEIHFLGVNYISSEFWQTMKELKEQNKQMKIYLKGFEMDCLRDLLDKPPKDARRKAFLKASALTTSDQAAFYLSNQSARSEKLPFFRVNYRAIEGLTGNAFDLFGAKRLPNVHVVSVSKQVKDELAFGRWLSRLDRLVEIVFKCPLSLDFYSNTLPASCPTLQGLTLDYCVAPLDVSFLLKFKFLIRLDLGSSDYSLVELLFSNLAHLRYVAFYECNGNELKQTLAVIKRSDGFQVYDGKEDMNYHSLLLRYKPIKNFETFASLVEFTKRFTGF